MGQEGQGNSGGMEQGKLTQSWQEGSWGARCGGQDDAGRKRVLGEVIEKTSVAELSEAGVFEAHGVCVHVVKQAPSSNRGKFDASAGLRRLLQQCRTSLAQAKVRSTSTGKVQELESLLDGALADAQHGNDVNFLESALTRMAGAASSLGLDRSSGALREGVEVARARYKAMLESQDAMIQVRGQAVLPLEQQLASEKAAWKKQYADVVSSHEEQRRRLRERHSEELLQLTTTQQSVLSGLQVVRQESLASSQKLLNAKLRKVASQYDPFINSMSHGLKERAAWLRAEECDFCDEQFFADEKPKSRKLACGVHCGDCPFRNCPVCGRRKSEPEADLCEVCGTSAVIFMCPSCSRFGDCLACQNCERDAKLYLCADCGFTRHADEEPCCCTCTRAASLLSFMHASTRGQIRGCAIERFAGCRCTTL
eukprot:TRINITY_DN122930_c0_g1_i1.p1 TRINITY_DN122930_c0_g1~~TRINITY_DN122930_c0_g1_i1.p1  ORF type:complete len:425 (+),score=76.73 TRINITY_DN122930_c0_g1_i1:621-1895(+)